MSQPSAGNIMVVDDDRLVLESVSALLRSHGFVVSCYQEGGEALAAFKKTPADVVLSDINMPVISGFRLMEMIRSFDTETPVIFITGNAELDVAMEAIKLQVFEFIVKPVAPLRLINAVEKAIRLKRLQQIEKNYRAELERTVVARTCELVEALDIQKKMSREIIERLTTATELRCSETGNHIARIGRYAGMMANALGLSGEFAETISIASAMHDIGKIAIPDAILAKPAHLSAEECTIIRTHTVVGEQILRGSSHFVLQMAAAIALTHHERWDGTGYPHGLRGADIPLAGRIVMLADQYDALRSRRVYKEPYGHEKACHIIFHGDDKTRPEHFDPEMLRTFRKIAGDFEEIFDKHQ